MTELHTLLNSLPEAEAARLVRTCCSAQRWVNAMLLKRPFSSVDGALIHARETWRLMERADILEAFQGHPQIGGDLAALREKYASQALSWSAQEQASVASASEMVLRRLAEGNATYLQRFGFIFVVCATGKSAAEMLALLEARIHNAPELELEIAAGEQEKILLLRLQKLAA